MAPESARSMYELHVIDSATSHRHTSRVLAFLGDLAGAQSAGGYAPTAGLSMRTITLEVVDRHDASVVLSLHERARNAHGVATLIEADLDRLDADAFENRWGIDRKP